MKRKIIIFYVIAICGMFNFASSAAAEEISDFRSEIKINADSSINVAEKIEYDFGALSRHGIFRNIPIKYKARGGNYNLRISNISVTDENRLSYKFQKSYPGNNIQIKIGDPNSLISRKKTYVINYKINRAINYFDSYDELYWNATGNEWPVMIRQVSAVVTLPSGADESQLKVQCYFGVLGSATNCQTSISGNELFFFAPRALSPGEGLTIVAGFPKGVVNKPTALHEILAVVLDNWILGLPLFVFLIMFYIWYNRGRDPKGRGTIIAEFGPPDELTPTEVGTIIDSTADNADISAEIIGLAVRGYIKITRIKSKKIIFDSTDYLLEKMKSEDDLKNEFEKNLMRDLFSSNLTELTKLKVSSEIEKTIVKNSLATSWVRLSDLKNRFYKSLSDLKNQVYKTVVDKGYFKKNPKTEKSLYTTIGIALAVVVIFFLSDNIGLHATISLVLSGIIIALFGLIMPARTKKGVLAKEYILGLKEYLTVAEKDRLKFHNAPEKNPQHFEALLPYAIVLGVADEWARQFEGIYLQPPSWYADATGSSFNFLAFNSSLTSFSASANSFMSTGASGGSSGFGGGGSSGGGFGGGGGGSW